ncbi:unnamed protein product [Auanema sp. JU1783]|nr:unnamed protein product [Auanema sp. JU1783]
MATHSVNVNEWRSFVSHVLSVWSGYQLAIDSNSGGDETKLKHEWLIDVLSEHIYTYPSLKVDDLDQWITNILYTDFDLILDDDSIYPTSHLLLEAFGFLKKNNRTGFDQLVAGLPSQQVIQEVKKTSQLQTNEDDEDDDMMAMDDVEEEMSDSEEVEKKERQPRMVTDDDGWTTILRK